jgi:ribosomal protein S4
LITHKKVFVGENNVNSPSYIIPVDLENKIAIRSKKQKKKIAKEENIGEKNE